ncbi:MAG: FISUMP domain-containing protein [Fibrobacter sp.]|nr:FISUMP domain-containing protein [Fibrobacter sp.]
MSCSRISGQFVCKMAMLLAFMFAACSETDSGNNVAGGTVEETGVYALVGQVGDIYPKLLQMADSDGVAEESSRYEGSVFAVKGSVITVYELDSLTFDTTGRSFVDTVDNDEGRFAFETLTLNSPYVLIEKQEPYDSVCVHVVLGEEKLDTTVKYRAFKSIVDLRQTQSVSVNSLTSAKITLLREFIADGKTFVDANRMAEREILEGFGIYEDLGAFETLNEKNSELPYVSALMQYGEFSLRFYLKRMDVFFLYASSKNFVGKGKLVEDYYKNSLKMAAYEVGYLAKLDGLGRCTESRENDVGKIKDELRKTMFIDVVCRSGKWTVGFKPIEHVGGTMVDSRDGKEYKTVTYNWGDGSQTWMAENLDFTGVDGVSCRRDLNGSDCDALGREYPWLAAMKIDYDDLKVYSVGEKGDTAFMTKECVDAFRSDTDVVGLEGWDDLRKRCDALYVDVDTTTGKVKYRIWYSNFSDLVKKSDVNSYQGICPDGWRIPTSNDWVSLLRHLGGQYGVGYGDVVPVLYDETATGFGLNSSAKLVIDDFSNIARYYGGSFYNSFLVVDDPWFVVELFNYGSGLGFGLEMPSVRHAFVFKLEEYLHDTNDMDPYAPYSSAPIRCIKN